MSWAINTRSSFNASVQIMADDKPGTISEISAMLSGMNISIQALNGHPDTSGLYMIEMTFAVTNIEQLNVIIKSLHKLNCVRDVFRMNR